MLLGHQGQEAHRIPHLDVRQLLVVVLLACLGHGPQVTVEAHHPALGFELVAVLVDGEGSAGELGRGHLAGDKLLPYQLIKTAGVVLHAIEVPRSNIDVGGANGFVGLLGARLAGVAVGLLRKVGAAKTGADIIPAGSHCLIAEVGGVGAHVGDVARFVEPLGHHHGLLDAEAEPRTGGLLECRGDEGRGGLGLGRGILPGADSVFTAREVCEGLVRLGLVDRPEILVLVFFDFEADLFLCAGLGIGVDRPELLGNEGADFPLPLHDQAHRHRLDAAGREAPGDLFPQQGGHHKAHHPVEETPGLLGIDPVGIEIAGVLEGFRDGLLGNFIEDHPLVAGSIPTDGLPQVPGDGLPLPVEVGGEIDGVGVAGQLFQFADHLLFAGENFIAGLPAVFRIDTHPCHQLFPGLAGLVAHLFLGAQLAGLGGQPRPLLGVHRG